MSARTVWALALMSAQLPAVARELTITASVLERMSARLERRRAQAAMAQALTHMSVQPMQASVWRLSRKTDGARKGPPKYLIAGQMAGSRVRFESVVVAARHQLVGAAMSALYRKQTSAA
jgi:hypothetical protein